MKKSKPTKTDELLKSTMVMPNSYRLAAVAIQMCKDLNERLKKIENESTNS